MGIFDSIFDAGAPAGQVERTRSVGLTPGPLAALGQSQLASTLGGGYLNGQAANDFITGQVNQRMPALNAAFSRTGMLDSTPTQFGNAQLIADTSAGLFDRERGRQISALGALPGIAGSTSTLSDPYFDNDLGSLLGALAAGGSLIGSDGPLSGVGDYLGNLLGGGSSGAGINIGADALAGTGFGQGASDLFGAGAAQPGSTFAAGDAGAAGGFDFGLPPGTGQAVSGIGSSGGLLSPTFSGGQTTAGAFTPAIGGAVDIGAGALGGLSLGGPAGIFGSAAAPGASFGGLPAGAAFDASFGALGSGLAPQGAAGLAAGETAGAAGGLFGASPLATGLGAAGLVGLASLLDNSVGVPNPAAGGQGGAAGQPLPGNAQGDPAKSIRVRVVGGVAQNWGTEGIGDREEGPGEWVTIENPRIGVNEGGYYIPVTFLQNLERFGYPDLEALARQPGQPILTDPNRFGDEYGTARPHVTPTVPVSPALWDPIVQGDPWWKNLTQKQRFDVDREMSSGGG